MSVTLASQYQFRKRRTRDNIFGTSDRPRLSVYRSSKHIYAQLVDDVKGYTLASASTLELRSSEKTGTPVAMAKKVGQNVGEKAKVLKVERVVFDRGGWPYHGRVQAVAEGAREAGLQF